MKFHYCLKKTAALILPIMCLLLAACRGESTPEASLERETCAAARMYGDLLDDSCQGDLEKILERLEEKGLTAVDVGGERGFVNQEPIKEFFSAIQSGQENELRFYRACMDGGLIGTSFYSSGGEWRCKIVRVSWGEGSPAVTYTLDYPLLNLALTEKGYLIYTCDIPNNTAPSKHDGYIEPTTMIRLEPQEELCIACRDRYLSKITYNLNNMFITSWSEEDFSQLCFNDLFLSLYQAESGMYLVYYNNPYPTDAETNVSHVPGTEFEALISKYIDVSAEELKSYAQYDAETDSYPIVLGGMHEHVLKAPVPEVTAVAENGDGTITLTVDALSVEYASDRAFTHLLTVRVSEDGSFRFVSNQMLHSETDIFPL